MQQNLENVLEEHKLKEENEAMTIKSQFDSIQILVSEKTEFNSTIAKLQKELQDLKGENAVLIKESQLTLVLIKGCCIDSIFLKL